MAKKRDPYCWEELLSDKTQANRQWEAIVQQAENGIINSDAIVNAMQKVNSIDYKIIKTPHRDLLG